MNRNAIASAISHRHGMSRAKALEILDDLLDVTREVLAEQGYVTFSGFGRFEVVRDQRTQRPPSVAFRAAPELRQFLAGKGMERRG